jgi:AcrR family transcriptional regulator
MARPKSDIDRRIVRAARARFLDGGVDGASVRAIAQAARTNLGMISYYFPTKDHLFLAVVEEVYAQLLSEVEAIFEEDTTFAEQIRRVAVRIGTMSEHEAEVMRLVLREGLLSHKRFRSLLARFQRGHIPVVVAGIQRAVERGEVDATTAPMPVLAACVVGAMAASQIVRRTAGDALPFAFPSAEATAEHAMKLLFDGIAPKPKRARVSARR